MVDKTLYVHIGTEKTGTTSLQSFLSLNARELEKRGFVYPSEYGAPYFHNDAHFPLVACLLEENVEFIPSDKKQTLADALPALLRLAKESPKTKFIVSAEQFSSRIHEDAALLRFKEQLAEVFDRICIVCYLREQAGWALSSYSTNVLGGQREPFNISEVVPENWYFNHMEMLERWGRVFGDESIVARDYDRKMLLDGDVCKDFCRLLEIHYEGLEPVAKLNTSRGAVEVEVLRLLNQVAPRYLEDKEAWRESRDLLFGIIVPRLVIPDDDLPKLSDFQRLTIIRRFKEHNERLCSKYLHSFSRDKWFAPDEMPLEVGEEPDPAEHVASKAVVALASTLWGVSGELYWTWLRSEELQEDLKQATNSPDGVRNRLEPPDH